MSLWGPLPRSWQHTQLKDLHACLSAPPYPPPRWPHWLWEVAESLAGLRSHCALYSISPGPSRLLLRGCGVRQMRWAGGGRALGEAAERPAVPVGTSWVRRDSNEGVWRSNPVALLFCVPCFLASPVFWPSGLWSFWLIFSSSSTHLCYRVCRVGGAMELSSDFVPY